MKILEMFGVRATQPSVVMDRARHGKFEDLPKALIEHVNALMDNTQEGRLYSPSVDRYGLAPELFNLGMLGSVPNYCQPIIDSFADVSVDVPSLMLKDSAKATLCEGDNKVAVTLGHRDIDPFDIYRLYYTIDLETADRAKTIHIAIPMYLSLIHI